MFAIWSPPPSLEKVKTQANNFLKLIWIWVGPPPRQHKKQQKVPQKVWIWT